MLDRSGQVGCEVGRDRFAIAKVQPAGGVLRRIVQAYRPAEVLLEVICALS
jgi:hypothetical protein